MLNKPRLADRYAQLLVSETGLGAKTPRDLAVVMKSELVALGMLMADAVAIMVMLDGNSLHSRDGCKFDDTDSRTALASSPADSGKGHLGVSATE